MVVVSLAAILRAPRALPPLGPPPTTTPLRSLRFAFTSVVVLAVVVAVDADLEREGADDDDDDDGEEVVVPLLFHP